MSRLGSIKLLDIIPLAWSALRRNRLRTSLTVGAIAFGVAVLVYLVALGVGLEDLTIGSVLRSATLLSFDVTTPNKDLNPLNHEALSRIQAIPQIKTALPTLSLKGTATLTGSDDGKEKVVPITILGVDPDYFLVNDQSTLVAGRSFADGETNSMVVSTSFLQVYGFPQDRAPLLNFSIGLDKQYADPPIVINDTTVRGVVNDPAISVYVPRAYLEQLLPTVPDYTDIHVLVNSVNDVSTAADKARALAFHVTTVIETVDEINQVFLYIRLGLAVIGGIAIVVASIGMFNTLTVSLLERTREIGIMKALGIKRSDIRRLFLVEALLIGLLGGLFGILLGVGLQQLTLFTLQVLALIANGVVPDLFINGWYLPVASLGFALSIAGLTGIYPANRAAHLNPIDAIRHE